MWRHHQAALAWAEARKLEFFALTTARAHRRIEWEVVKLEERHIGRTVRPFNLDLRVLPLAEPWAWRLAPDRALMSLSMCRDRAAYRSWLTAVVRAGLAGARKPRPVSWYFQVDIPRPPAQQ